MPTSLEDMKDVARRITEEAWNKGNLDLVDELLAPDFVDHNPHGGTTRDREGYKNFIRQVRSAFPDLQNTDEDLIAEGDKVVSRWTTRATHQGDWMGAPPTGNQVEGTGIIIWRIVEGKVVERWNNYDALGLLRQVGVEIPV
jgi:steroid delta-isomerase-like uncharacterized protein